MEEQGIFKNAVFGGFDRQSVLDYIKTITENAQQAQGELTQKLAEATKRNDELITISTEDGEALEAAQKYLKEEKEKNAILLEKINLAVQEVDRQKKMLAERDRELQAEMERGKQLTVRNTSLEEKCRKFDDNSMQLGAIMLEAQKNADDVILAAQKRAKEIIADSEAYVVQISRNVVVLQKEYALIKDAVKQQMQAITDKLDAVGAAISESQLAIEHKEDQKKQAVEQEKLETEDWDEEPKKNIPTPPPVIKPQSMKFPPSNGRNGTTGFFGSK